MGAAAGCPERETLGAADQFTPEPLRSRHPRPLPPRLHVQKSSRTARRPRPHTRRAAPQKLSGRDLPRQMRIIRSPASPGRAQRPRLAHTRAASSHTCEVYI